MFHTFNKRSFLEIAVEKYSPSNGFAGVKSGEGAVDKCAYKLI
jgi:hypothetical protein